MRSRAILALTLSALCANGISAQTTANADVNATITTDLSVVTTGATDFGTIGNATSTVSVNPGALGPGQSAATIAVAGSAAASVQVSATSTTLTATGGGTIPFTSSLYVSATGANDPSGAMIWGSSASITLTAAGDYYLWLGGSINVSANQQPGAYSGTVTVSVTYN